MKQSERRTSASGGLVEFGSRTKPKPMLTRSEYEELQRRDRRERGGGLIGLILVVGLLLCLGCRGGGSRLTIIIDEGRGSLV